MSGKKIAGSIACATCALIAAAAAVSVMAKGNTNDTQIGENQSIGYAYVASIEGNELTYAEVEESVVSALLEGNEETRVEHAQESTETSKDGTSSIEEGETSMKESAVGDSGSFQGDSGSFSGERPNGSGEMNGTQTEMVTTLIPVGTLVHTAVDTETTFARLAAGDFLKLLFETSETGEEMIVEIWMVQ